MPGGSPKPDQVVPRDLTEFLIELSVALYRHSMYPDGHPALAPAVAGVASKAERLLQERSSIAFGVARRQLIIEGVATDPDQPVLRRLAETLHRHHLGALSVLHGVREDELTAALRALATEPEIAGPLGLAKGARQTSWPHLRLHPITFDGLAIVSDAVPPQDGSGARGAELWAGLARAALSADAADEQAGSADPSVVARSINDHPQADAYDQMIVGYMLQIAQELRTSGGEDATALRRRTSALVASLQPDTLRRLVEMGGNAAQRGRFVLDAAHGMAVDAVIEVAKAAADAGGRTISNGLLRMLTKLAAHAEHGPASARPLADAALREQVVQLQSGWSLEDPNPEAYGRMLQHLAASRSADEKLGDRAGPRIEPTDPVRLVQMGLESGVAGSLVDRAVDEAVRLGQLPAVIDLLAVPPDGSEAASEVVMARLLAPPTLRALLSQEPLDVASLDSLLPYLKAEGFELVLDALAASEHRATRSKLLDRLARSAPDIGLAVAARLKDERWYVQRNMLVLLARSGRVPVGFSPAQWTVHPDGRLRYEALRLQLGMPHEHEEAVATALSDSDSRIVRLGLAALQQECSPMHVDGIAALALEPSSDEEMRLLAVGALGRLRHSKALDALLTLADGGRTLLGRRRLPPKSPVLLAVLRILAEVWTVESNAAAVVKLAAESPDQELRESVRGQTR